MFWGRENEQVEFSRWGWSATLLLCNPLVLFKEEQWPLFGPALVDTHKDTHTHRHTDTDTHTLLWLC